MIDHVGIYGSRVAKGLSASNVGLVQNSEHNNIFKVSLKVNKDFLSLFSSHVLQNLLLSNMTQIYV